MIKKSFGIRKSDIINRRMFIIGAAKLIIFGGLISRLFSLQINENKKYLTLSDKNRIREWKLPPTRGNIVDYFGNVIAGNLKVYQLHVIPEQVENFNYLISRLKVILNLSDKRVEKIKKKKKQLKPWESLIVSENLSWDEFSKINNYLYELVGVKPVMTISRDYPFDDIYTHVLGYVSQPSEIDILENEAIKEKFVPTGNLYIYRSKLYKNKIRYPKKIYGLISHNEKWVDIDHPEDLIKLKFYLKELKNRKILLKS